MNRAAFRRFEFFDVETISEDISNPLGNLPTCVIAESGMLIFGDESGYITFSDRDFHISERKNKVFKGEVKGLAFIFDPTNNNRQYIITIGDDAKTVYQDGQLISQPMYMIKVFKAQDMNRPIHVINATVSDAILTSFAVLHDGTEIALGFSTGKVLLYTGLFLKESSQRQTTPNELLAAHFAPVSGLYFTEVHSIKNDERKIKLVAVMDTTDPSIETRDNRPAVDVAVEEEDIENAGIIVFDTSLVYNQAKNNVTFSPKRDPKALDEKGAPKHCITFMKSTSELIIARTEAIYTYTVEDRGGAMAIFGDKLGISTVGRYTLIVSNEEKTTTGNNEPSSKSKKATVNIYDLKNKIICGTNKKYTLPSNEKINFVLSDSGIAYLITSSWNLIRFREKDVNRKLDVLLNQVNPPLYSLAIMLAIEEQLEPSEITKLYKMYGDHLYGKNDFDGAIVQYCNTIGYIPPSYVIIKFLDPYRITNLITYLEKIKEKQLASADHITLLLNCYTKLKDENKIDQLLTSTYNQVTTLTENFWKSQESDAVENIMNLNEQIVAIFDPIQAIKILKSAGFVEQALKVSIKFEQYESYFGLQFSKKPIPYDEVIGYIAYISLTCPNQGFIMILNRYGRQLLDVRPKPFANLLIKLCANDLSALLNSTPASQTTASTPAKKIATLATEDLNPLWSNESLKTFNLLSSNTKSYQLNEPLSPLDALPIFSDHNDMLLYFLEGVSQLAKGKILPSIIWSTLLELYMKKYQENITSSTPDMIQIRNLEITIMNILDGPHVQYDPGHVLLLCHLYSFTKGERYLLEKQHHIELLMSKFMERNEHKEIFRLLRKDGTREADLMAEVLSYFVKQTMLKPGEDEASLSKRVKSLKLNDNGDDLIEDEDKELENEEDEDDFDDAKWDNVIDVLDLVEKDCLLPPSQVLSILAINPKLPLKIASGYINNLFRDITEDISTVESNMKVAMKNLASINDPSDINNQINEKSIKRNQMNYDDYDDEEDLEELKLRKQKEDDRWNSIRKEQIVNSMDHESFYKELELSTDGFSTIASYFGRSIIM